MEWHPRSKSQLDLFHCQQWLPYCVQAIVPEGSLMKNMYSEMTLLCSRGVEPDPFKREGLPEVVEGIVGLLAA